MTSFTKILVLFLFTSLHEVLSARNPGSIKKVVLIFYTTFYILLSIEAIKFSHLFCSTIQRTTKTKSFKIVAKFSKLLCETS